MEGDPRDYGRESGRKEQEKRDAAYLFPTLLSVVDRKKKSAKIL